MVFFIRSFARMCNKSEYINKSINKGRIMYDEILTLNELDLHIPHKEEENAVMLNWILEHEYNV